MPKTRKSATTRTTTARSHNAATQSTDTPQPATTTANEAAIERANRQGFFGIEVDPTPNENYTVAGVTANAPTPETDLDAAIAAREATGLGLSPVEAAEREKAATEEAAEGADEVAEGEEEDA